MELLTVIQQFQANRHEWDWPVSSRLESHRISMTLKNMQMKVRNLPYFKNTYFNTTIILNETKCLKRKAGLDKVHILKLARTFVHRTV
jgi:hypothetical protein